ncbi:MAG: fumarylacetoacetate hydrolase family protein, partial [Planctomycetota bacterium]
RVRDVDGPALGSVEEIVAASVFPHRASADVVLLAPNDLLATKACGVTFIRSLLERVVEEKAKGDPAAAKQVRRMILDSLGEDLSRVKPGSPETRQLKEKFIEAGVWSQYLEVGIGPDAEVFTKAQPMASVGYGEQIGVLPDSSWNNPEPEIVLAVSRRGEIRGATLGNDVNLRDYEGRSALLLGEAKDQNGSCAIGPMIRLFDDDFTLADVEQCEVALSITGVDGFTTRGKNRMAEISRSPADLVSAAIGKHHQYPDGLVLFLGTMFAPTDDRGQAGAGFTHKLGDRVEIATQQLGTLVNWVNHTDAIPPWEFGATALIDFLRRRANA